MLLSPIVIERLRALPGADVLTQPHGTGRHCGAQVIQLAGGLQAHVVAAGNGGGYEIRITARCGLDEEDLLSQLAAAATEAKRAEDARLRAAKRLREPLPHDKIELARTVRATGSWRDVGAALNITAAAAQRYLKRNDEQRPLQDWTYGLEMKTARALIAAGFGSREQVRAAVERGEAIERIKAARLEIIRNWLAEPAFDDV